MLAEQMINFVAASSAPQAIVIDEPIEATKQDTLLQRVTELIRLGRRDRSKEMELYMANRHELSVADHKSNMIFYVDEIKRPIQ
jgi:hypothetical protein